MRAVVAEAEQRTGRTLAGVLHMAGADTRTLWQDTGAHVLAQEDPAEFHRMFHAKVFGTCALGDVLRDRPDAVLVLSSSVNGYFGGNAYGAYSAASGFLHGFAAAWPGPVRCMAWSMWRDIGMNRANPARTMALRRGFRDIDPTAASGCSSTRWRSPPTLSSLASTVSIPTSPASWIRRHTTRSTRSSRTAVPCRPPQ